MNVRPTLACLRVDHRPGACPSGGALRPQRRSPPLRSVARRPRGFTLIELIITMSIAAILLTIGIPTFRSVIQNARTAAMASDLTSALNLARAEAVKRGSPVQLCPSDDRATCGGAWTDGWIVRSVVDGAVIRAWDAPAVGAVIGQTPNANTAIDFGVLGEVTSNDTELVASVVGCTGPRARTLALAPSGRVSVRRTDCP